MTDVYEVCMITWGGRVFVHIYITDYFICWLWLAWRRRKGKERKGKKGGIPPLLMRAVEERERERERGRYKKYTMACLSHFSAFFTSLYLTSLVPCFGGLMDELNDRCA
ncbi:hypothetical protein GGS21DRAFT_524544 [Xylaria nigripes]|nr:hypothetical protein GGS21DRAFT_524544 [Xylaria nigripes]